MIVSVVISAVMMIVVVVVVVVVVLIDYCEGLLSPDIVGVDGFACRCCGC